MNPTIEGTEFSDSWLTRSGFGFVTALLILLTVEGLMHDDALVARYAAVFGAGRAMEKMLQVESSPPKLLLLGNSRMDNGYDPRELAATLELRPEEVFNLGIPGANLTTLQGVVARLDHKGLLGEKGIRAVVLALDENELLDDDSLNLNVFLADRGMLLEEGDYRTWLGSWIRLWGFSDNLKGLREPGKLHRFLQASVQSVAPFGGHARNNLGFRPGQRGRFQNEAQLLMQEAGTRRPPSPRQLRALWQLLDLLEKRGVQAAILYPPLLHRLVAFLPQSAQASPAHRAIDQKLGERGIPRITVSALARTPADQFANAGHLNAQGAKRHSRLLAAELKHLWGNLLTPGNETP